MAGTVGTGAVGRAREPRRFFELQLRGEDPLSFETAKLLYEISVEILVLQPWKVLEDRDLILLEDPGSGEICHCSVMGGLGSVYAVHVYVGAESYRFFHRILKGKSVTGGDFYASMKGVCLEFALPSGRTPHDRELLDAVGHPNKRGRRAPIFRAFRPGYHPWYLTEGEGNLLLYCLKLVYGLCRFGLEPEAYLDLWPSEDQFPFLTPIATADGPETFEVLVAKAPEPPFARPPAAKVEDHDINEILGNGMARSGTLEVDHFYALAEIGKKDERKACLSAAIVCDGESGLALQPELGQPGEPAGDLLVRAILGAIRKARAVPLEIRVRKQEFKYLLEGLSAKLGIVIHVKKSLAMLDPFKEVLLAHMGDPGEFSGE